jgi:hypothetical protein
VVEADRGNALVHLSLISDVMDGVMGFLERLNVFAAVGLVYDEWPEMREDFVALMKHVTELVVKIKALT